MFGKELAQLIDAIRSLITLLIHLRADIQVLTEQLKELNGEIRKES